PYKLHAFDITAGATTWYAQSEQYYTQNKSASGVISNSLVKSDPAFLYGPTLAVRFSQDFNLTFVYLYGTFETEKDQGSGRKSTTKFSRSDSDLALNYRLGNYFKVFIGAKYLSYGITPAKSDSFTFQINGNADIHNSYGPGLGLSATYPIIDNLFVLGTVSGLYLWGGHSVSIADIGGSNRRSVDLEFNEYGVNTNLSLAYYIAPASTVISLGGRYQYLKADYKKNAIYLDSIKFTIWGAVLTATYTFSI
ncbi:MAG: hypothetical protein FWG49_04795, partial [Leptospirales bacterium]|nr:hypothetical protein [Leptospirales bacterium]